MNFCSLHVVFGHVVSGHDLVRQLEQLPVDRNSRPLQDAVISNCGELVRQIKGIIDCWSRKKSEKILSVVSFTVKKVKRRKSAASESESGSSESDEDKKKKKKKKKKAKKE